jgi:hypothetical protein
MEEEAIGYRVYQPVTVQAPLGDLRHLCRLAVEAGDDLQAVARVNFAGIHPVSVRRRNREIAAAQQVIDTVRALEASVPQLKRTINQGE